MWKYNSTDELFHSDELYHYGILGMRWRHRKAQIKKYKDLKKMQRQKKNDDFKKDINSNARAFGSDYVRRKANAKTMIGAAELARAAVRFNGAKKHNFGTNGQLPMYMNAGFNAALAARGVQNLIEAKKTRNALNEYEYNRLKNAKKNKRK